jgi:hypothetical protein
MEMNLRSGVFWMYGCFLAARLNRMQKFLSGHPPGNQGSGQEKLLGRAFVFVLVKM